MGGIIVKPNLLFGPAMSFSSNARTKQHLHRRVL